jgi:hypothetical protein
MKEQRRISTWAVAVAAAVFAIGAAQAAKPVVYPAKGQSPQQQQSDDGACMEGRGYTIK